ncbi:Dilute domain-containing protein C25B8.08 [Wickerhamiella sorbophila]|uniref:Dilute domain-containing protein C25B8.08 n=1 Tax=Wickerhamiella sorbophila TaxID=45607 RepID=A0A2T0FN95_9ASCO|nr:Dilute domain-containing protein C25B8.08 [Wickerhamiella sorbophila]PRT56454.1 Dilute domain-containing protein C25B8.08 [Wickerhamiella sorbophila]
MSAWAREETTLDVDAIIDDETMSEEQREEKLEHLLIEFSQNGQSEKVHELLGNDRARQMLDIEAKDTAGSTALIYASCYGNESVVTELLRYGANPDSQDRNEWTSLMWAVNNHHLSIVQHLLENGADVNIKTSTGRSAVDICSPGDLIHSYLLSNGHITEAEPDDFYKQAENPAEYEEEFERKVEESTLALGLNVANLSLDKNDAPFGGHSWAPEIEVDFDWDHYLPEQSFVVDAEHISKFLDLVITRVHPTLQKKQAPVSANALFLAIRFYVYNGPSDALTSLLYPISRRIMTVVEQNATDLTYLCYWLANTSILAYYMQRDSKVNEETAGDFQITLKEVERTLLHKVALCVEELLAAQLPPCLLDYANIPGINEVQFRNDWKIFHRKNKPSVDAETEAERGMLPPSMEARMRPAPTRVTSILSSLLLILDVYNVHPVITQQVFSQVLYWMGAELLNSVLGDKKYLSRTRAMQIRLNVSNIEDWCRSNNRRPDDADEFSKAVKYKSMTDLCRDHLGPLTDILQWLQTFSGFGSDFTTVVATMQELTHVNPKQLLYAAKKYRVEVNEPQLSKDYKHYLADLANHYETQQQSEQIDLLGKDEENFILKTTKATKARDVLLDVNHWFALFPPNMKEMISFWGGGLGGVDTSSPHYLVPTVPVEIADSLDAGQQNKEIYDTLKQPAATRHRQWNEDEEWEEQTWS